MKHREFRKSTISLVVTTAMSALAIPAATANTSTWTGGAYYQATDGNGNWWWTDGGSDWATAGNWNGGVPASGDVANIDTATAGVPAGLSSHPVVQVTNAQGASIVNVGTTSGGSGLLDILGGGSLTVVNQIRIGQAAGSTGTVRVRAGANLNNAGNLIVGDAGDGVLDIEGQASTTGKVIIANQGGSSGVVNVKGGTMTNGGTLTVGENGNGTLNIVGGTVDTLGQAVIASRGNSTSVVQLNQGGRLSIGGNLTVAEEGVGDLLLDGSSSVKVGGTTVIGSRSSARGNVVVTGGSSLSSLENLVVGENGQASLVVSDAGKVTNRNSIMADRRGSESRARVTGAGSIWTSTGDLTVGYGGNGSLQLDREGRASVGSDGKGNVYLAIERTSKGTINIGADTQNAADAVAAGHLDAGKIVFGEGEGAVNFNHANKDYQFNAGFEGNGKIKQVAGETVLNGNAGLFTGTTQVIGGTLIANNDLAGTVQVGTSGTLRIGYQNGSTGDVLSDIENNGVVAFQRGDTYVYRGMIHGAGGVRQSGTGTTVLTGASTYAGGTQVVNGTLQLGDGNGGGKTGSIVGNVDVQAPGTFAFNRSNEYVFGGVFSGNGRIDQRGLGRTMLTADSSGFAGSTVVSAGTLSVNGRLGGTVDVQAGGTLAGIGQVGSTVIHEGGAVAPGNSIGTLTIAGDLIQKRGSTYQVELESSGARDHLAVSGSTQLDDGSFMNVAKLDSARYQLDRRYVVLNAVQGVTGRYKLKGDIVVSTFYSLQDNYDAHNVYLDVQQSRLFQEAADTSNQRAVAAAAQSLKGDAVPSVVPPKHNELFKSIAYLADDAQARNAFDLISGEFHVSARSALIEESQLIRDAANARLRSAFSLNGIGEAKSGSGITPWFNAIGNSSDIKGDGNAAKLRRDTYGFMAGVDAPIGERVRLGAFAGYSNTDLKGSARRSSSKNDNVHAGLYGGLNLDRFSLRAGAAYTWSEIDAKRHVDFAGYNDLLKSKYDASTAQVFGELGYRFDLSPTMRMEPFANLAYVRVKTDAFKESGGAAALAAKSESDSQTFSTLGLRVSGNVALTSENMLTVFGQAGWRHAFGSGQSSNTFQFNSSDSFRIAGMALARNSAVVGAGFETQLKRNLTLGASYNGQFGGDARQHGLNVNAAYRY